MMFTTARDIREAVVSVRAGETVAEAEEGFDRDVLGCGGAA